MVFSPSKQKDFNTEAQSGVQFFEEEEEPPTLPIIDPQ
jgi:hypothetical protein